MISIPPLLEILSVDSIAFARLTDYGNETAAFLVALHAPSGIVSNAAIGFEH